jgi:hypothetical protein
MVSRAASISTPKCRRPAPIGGIRSHAARILPRDAYGRSLEPPCCSPALTAPCISLPSQASFVGAVAVADLVKSTLGPKGMVR